MRHGNVPERVDLLVIGAGLSGLTCARRAHEEGLDVLVLDAADAVGGRIRTDVIDGFRLDRGFQVLLTAYDELHTQVDLDSLDLKPFTPGSTIWNGRSLETLGDPFRIPSSALASARARVGSLDDKLRVARLRRRLLASPPEAAFDGPERSTLEELRAEGFSDAFIDQFFRPFLGGVFLERELETSSSLFRYYFRCFAAGDAAVPAEGMQRLPEAMAESLQGRILLDTSARTISDGQVTLDDGSTIAAAQIVLAADANAAAKLGGSAPPGFKPTITSYYAAPSAPVAEALLVLDGEGSGPVNHVGVMSNVSSAYAPAGQHLIAVSGVGEAAEDAATFPNQAKAQLTLWFGPEVERWDHIKTYQIRHALPQHPAGFAEHRPPRRATNGAWLAGDYTDFGAIQGAIRSGRTIAESLIQNAKEPHDER